MKTEPPSNSPVCTLRIVIVFFLQLAPRFLPSAPGAVDPSLAPCIGRQVH
jgi:hypothetical protein